MNSILQDKKILITGASSGIGRATAILFSQHGANIILNGRDESRLKETMSHLSRNNHSIIVADLADEKNIDYLMDQVFEKIGALDAVIHCCGIHKTLPLQALKYSDFDDVFSVNVKSAQFIAKSLRRRGRFNPDGTSLVYLSSVAATCGKPAISTYSASKAALQGLTKSLAVELARNNIRVNCISPGYVHSEMASQFKEKLSTTQFQKIQDEHPLGLGSPEDVANSALFLASDMARWITGTVLYVDGGYSAH